MQQGGLLLLLGEADDFPQEVKLAALGGQFVRDRAEPLLAGEHFGICLRYRCRDGCGGHREPASDAVARASGSDMM